ncbi:MAG: FAD binding domain-containing protein [Treponema sp.]|nr:FAD binding domain-containing protein [Treponema sp.]
MQELFYQMKSVAGLRIVGGCTALNTLPEKALSVRAIPELRHIDKHERYVNFGSAVTLSDIIDVGSNRVPEIFLEAIQSIAHPFVRNCATIGGNIAAGTHGQTLIAPLLALDAHIEMRNATKTISVPLTKFNGVPDGMAATHIRVPLRDWNISVFRRIGPQHVITPTSAAFAFLAASEKRILTNIKIAFAGPITFRAIELENRLISSRLPLSPKAVATARTLAIRQFDACAGEKEFPRVLRTQFIRIIQAALEQLT